MTGKVGSASSRNKRNLLVVDLWHVDRPIVFSRGLVFHVESLPWSRVSSGFWVLLAHGHSSFISTLSKADSNSSSLLFYRRQPHGINPVNTSYRFSLLHALPHHLDILSIGESLSLMPLTLIAPGAGFVFCCIYSTTTVGFFSVSSTRALSF